MKIVSNASPLIFLAKIGMLELLNDYEVIIPKQVRLEIKKGQKTGKEDSYKIENMIEADKIKVNEIGIIKELKQINIGEGEKAAIGLAVDKKIKIIFLDERKARRTAKFFNLHPRGTIGILREARN
jgi:uncharacterized protein